jgi:hypothetical protein
MLHSRQEKDIRIILISLNMILSHFKNIECPHHLPPHAPQSPSSSIALTSKRLLERPYNLYILPSKQPNHIPSTMPSGSRHGHSHSHRDGKEKKGETSAPKVKYEWFWLCCECQRHHLSKFTEACPEFDCGHTRCTGCTWEEQEVRKAI